MVKLSSWADAGLDDPLYQPEVVDGDDLAKPLTKADFIDLCHGDLSAAEVLFARVDWQHPETVLMENGGYEQFVFNRYFSDLKTSIGKDAVFNSAMVLDERGGTLFSFIFPEGLDHLFADGGLESDQWLVSELVDTEQLEAVRAEFLQIGQQLSPEHAKQVIFSPWAQAPDRAVMTCLAAHDGDARGGIPAERAYIHATGPLDPFSQRKLHVFFQQFWQGQSSPRFEALRKAEPEVDSMLTFAAELVARSEGVLSAEKALAARYGGKNEVFAAEARPLAYIGDVVYANDASVYLHDLIQNRVVRFERDSLPACVNTPGSLQPDRVGYSCAISLVDGGRSRIFPCRAVADVLVESACAKARGAQKDALQHLQVDDHDIMFDGEPVGSYFPSMMNGSNVGSDGGRVVSLPLDEPLARRLSERGLPLRYAVGSFYAQQDDLQAAVCRDLGAYRDDWMFMPGWESVVQPARRDNSHQAELV